MIQQSSVGISLEGLLLRCGSLSKLYEPQDTGQWQIFHKNWEFQHHKNLTKFSKTHLEKEMATHSSILA